MYTARLSELMYPLVAENADSHGAGTVNSACVSVATYHRVWLVLDVGDMVQDATLDAGLQQATTTACAGVKAIAGKTITQLTQAGGDGNDLVCIELQTEELDVDGGFDCVRFYVTVAGAAVEYSAILYVCEPRFAPTPTANWTEVTG